MSDDEIVLEDRLLIENLDGIASTFVSDHILNLLEEVEGKLPEEKGRMLGLIDRYLALPPEEKANFRLGRRMGVYRSVDDLFKLDLKGEVERAIRWIELERPEGFEKVISDLMESFL